MLIAATLRAPSPRSSVQCHAPWGHRRTPQTRHAGNELILPGRSTTNVGATLPVSPHSAGQAKLVCFSLRRGISEHTDD
jgi:hypothetical protein